jgi:hypothetical protein
MDHTYLMAGGAFSLAAHAFGLVMTVSAVMALGGIGGWVLRLGRHALTPYRPGWTARVAAWRAARPFRALPAPASASAALREGAACRLRGVVVSGDAGDARPAELSGLSCVVCRHAFGERRGGMAGAGTSARDFVLRLADGTEVRVLAADAAERRRLRFVDASPQRWSSTRPLGSWCWESRVCPGDEIEVMGTLVRQVDPSAPRLGDRSPALRWMVAGEGAGLCLRFATSSAPLSLTSLP